MTVGELKAALEGMDDGLQVVIATDAEGNDYSPLRDGADEVTVGAYVADAAWTGRFWPEQEAPRKHPINAVCLWPVN